VEGEVEMGMEQARARVGGAADAWGLTTLDAEPALAPLAPADVPGGVPWAGVGWNDAETHDVEMDPRPGAGGLGSAPRDVMGMGMDRAAAEVSVTGVSSSLSELLSHASSQSSRDCRPEVGPLALAPIPGVAGPGPLMSFAEALAGRRGLEEVRNRAFGSTRCGCALCGRAGGAVGIAVKRKRR
jgi:hypothetical protein